jgi:Zn-dependent protease
MNFRLFGVPTHVQLGFWLTTVMFGMGLMRTPHLLLVWVAVVFVSILFHEMGHAVAMARFGLQPEITLWGMGGLTSGHGQHRLSRPRRIFISFAGPLAGFIFGGMIIGAEYLFAEQLARDPGMVTAFAVMQLKYVNIGWGLINLVPVWPLDGGNMLEDALGPRRAKITLLISVAAGLAVVAWALSSQQWYVALLIGLCALQSYRRYREAASGESFAKRRDPVDDALPPEIAQRLQEARAALGDDEYERARALAELVLASRGSRRARREAYEVLGWVDLLEGRIDEAARQCKNAEREGRVDPALAGAVLFAKDDLAGARQALEAARAEGDDRKEVVGPLIQTLLKQGDAARAAAVALDVVDTLSDEDVRQMASIAGEHAVHGWAARLGEALFERTGSPDDAYAAARSRALDDDPSAALLLLRRAVAAGFKDAARVWSDAALQKLRDGDGRTELEALLPRS